jgi:hypothetical protein
VEEMKVDRFKEALSNEREIKKILSEFPMRNRGTTDPKIEGNIFGASFEIAKEGGTKFNNYPIIFLKVSGSEESRSKVIERFLKVLGPPESRYRLNFDSLTEYLWWYSRVLH